MCGDRIGTTHTRARTRTLAAAGSRGSRWPSSVLTARASDVLSSDSRRQRERMSPTAGPPNTRTISAVEPPSSEMGITCVTRVVKFSCRADGAPAPPTPTTTRATSMPRVSMLRGFHAVRCSHLRTEIDSLHVRSAPVWCYSRTSVESALD